MPALRLLPARPRALLLVALAAACAPAARTAPAPASSPAPAAVPAPAPAPEPPARLREPIPPVEPSPEFQRAVERGTRTTTGRPGPGYWQQWTEYRITAELDTTAAMLTGREP